MIDLLSLIGQDTVLKRTASGSGGEWSGSCPFCGGRDRFNVWPNHPNREGGRWWCRMCGKEGGAVWYLMQRDGLTRSQAQRQLGVTSPNFSTARQKRSAPQPVNAPPPSLAWQERAMVHMERCEQRLWSVAGKEVLAYLHDERGLSDYVIRHYRLGYNSRENLFENPALWGLDGKKIFLGRGVIIPHIVGEQVWGIKVRLLRPTTWQGREVKYSAPRGGVTNLFGAGDLRAGGLPLLLTEGEFDMMLAWEKAGDLVDVATLSGARRGIPKRWLFYLLPYDVILAAYDNDDAGREGVAKIASLSKRIRIVSVPSGGDITDFWRGGGDVKEWLQSCLDCLADTAPEAEVPHCEVTDAPPIVEVEVGAEVVASVIDIDALPTNACGWPGAGLGRHRGFWLCPTGGWVCGACHPMPPGLETQTYQLAGR